MDIVTIDNLIKAVCPIYGVSSTGRIDYKDEATAEQRTAAQAIMDTNLPLLGVVTPEQIQTQLTQAVQNYLDSKARERGYDSIFTACTYAGDPNPTWSAEGTAYKAWRSAVWQYCLTVMAAVQAGTRVIPTESELLAELPVFGG